MSKLLVFTYAALGVLVQVDFPDAVPVPKGQPKPEKPEPFERSCEGSVHFRPGSTVLLTKHEVEFLRAQRPEVAKHLLFVAEHQSAEDKVEAAKAASAAVHNAPSPTPSPSASGAGASLEASSGGGSEDPPKKGKGSKQGGSGD